MQLTGEQGCSEEVHTMEPEQHAKHHELLRPGSSSSNGTWTWSGDLLAKGTCCSFTCCSSLTFKPGTLFLHRCPQVMKTVQGDFSSLHRNSQRRQHLEKKKAEVPHTLTQLCNWCYGLVISEVLTENMSEKKKITFLLSTFTTKNKGRSEKSSVLFPPHMSLLNLTEDLTKAPDKSQGNNSSRLSSKSLVPLVRVHR